jgi:hypothetical protein
MEKYTERACPKRSQSESGLSFDWEGLLFDAPGASLDQMQGGNPLPGELPPLQAHREWQRPQPVGPAEATFQQVVYADQSQQQQQQQWYGHAEQPPTFVAPVSTSSAGLSPPFASASSEMERRLVEEYDQLQTRIDKLRLEQLRIEVLSVRGGAFHQFMEQLKAEADALAVLASPWPGMPPPDATQLGYSFR